MDELIIGDKKYISSKQAAKATGYAKDYVGQLCREGRVPARLIGRAWYVLESAIQDHRFSERTDETGRAEKSALTPLQSTWEAPRYEASETEVLPSVNRLHENEPLADGRNEDAEITQRLQETWQAWFDRFDQGAGAKETETAVPNEEKKIEENQVVNIPIRAVYQPRYQPPPEELLPRHRVKPQSKGQNTSQEGRRAGRIMGRAIQATGMLCAVLLAILAVLGSGYLDTYILSVSQVRIIAGVSLYNK